MRTPRLPVAAPPVWALPVRALVVATVVALCAAAAWATIVVHADVARLTELSDLVVEGTVKSRSTVYDAAAGAIWTTHRVEVTDTLSGDAPETLDVWVPGGKVADLEQDVSGTPTLRDGERVILFLWKDSLWEDSVRNDSSGNDASGNPGTRSQARFQILGQAQGCFHIVAGDDGALVGRNDVKGLALVDADGGHVDAEPIALSRADLRKRITEVVTEREAQRARRKAAVIARLERLRERAEETARRTRGKPGGAE